MEIFQKNLKKFYLKNVEDDYYSILTGATIRKMGLTSSENNIYQSTYSGMDSQKWKVIENSDKTYTFQNKATKYLIKIDATKIKRNTKIIGGKEEKNDFVDSVGELVAYCEKNGGQIPRFELDAPVDIIDTVIKDLKEYTKSLIYSDTALARQIEEYIKKKEIVDQQKKDREEAKDKGLEAPEMSDEDFLEYSNSLEEQKQEDATVLGAEAEPEDAE